MGNSFKEMFGTKDERMNNSPDLHLVQVSESELKNKRPKGIPYLM